MSNLALLLVCGQVSQPLYVDDCFVPFTRVGTGASQTTTTNIDMSKGYCLWSKGRSGATSHSLYHSARGVTKELVTDTTVAEVTQAQGLTAVSSTGHTYGTYANVNTSTATYVDWVWRNAPKFYAHSVVVKSAGSNATVDLSTLGTVGMVRVKRTDAAGSWYIWHKDLTAGNLLIGETTAAQATLGHITISGTTLTLVNGVIADGTYLVEGFAHDTSATGIIQCGSFTTDASGNATVNLGWETQYLMLKNATGLADVWNVYDTARGFVADKSSQSNRTLAPNTSAAEGPNGIAGITAVGIVTVSLQASVTYIYLAIRRPNKPPTSGTQVYNAIARTGTGAAATVTGVGFAPDLHHCRARINGYESNWVDRLRGATKNLWSDVTSMENTTTDAVMSFEMDGVVLGTDGTNGFVNSSVSSRPYINHFFRRAPGFFDEVCYTGTGVAHTEAHNLNSIEDKLYLVKGRSGITTWVWGSTLLADTEKIVMPSPNGKVTDATAWNSTYPTATTISLGTLADVNTNAATYVLYLWATLAGVSKVFTYTGNGATLTIPCGFSAGARFVMIIRITASTAQDIFIFDTARGIVAGNDPHLSLNSTAAEVTTDDSIDPDSSGFIVNQLAATNINVNGAVYIGLAIA